MKKILLVLLSVFVVLVAVITLNTLTFSSSQPEASQVTPESVSPQASQHLADALAIPTISNEDGNQLDSAAFRRFREFISETYPLADSMMQTNYINEFSMVMHWQGSDPSLKPVILMGHIDVVPVPEENMAKWTHPPFGGVISEGVIWGRGAIDNKINVVGLMEAAEHLLAQGFRPDRSVYFCFGHDEEVGGLNGAVQMVKFLQEKNVSPEFVLDEGGVISTGLIPGIDKTVAMIATGEKGFVTLHLRLQMEGGHSSTPASESAIDVMSRALIKLKDNPFPAEVSQPLDDFLNTLGPHMSPENKIFLANRWLFEPLVLRLFSSSNQGNAMVRTTTAPTIIRAGVKDNVIPYEARATVNFRLLPGITPEEIEEKVREIIDDERILIEQASYNIAAPPASPSDSESYHLIARSIRQTFPEYLITPTLLSGATDSRHFLPLTNNIYRFTPIHLDQDNQNIFHGINERVSEENFHKAIQYYILLLRNAGRKIDDQY